MRKEGEKRMDKPQMKEITPKQNQLIRLGWE